MSRIIVKNLPKKVTAKRVTKIFSSKGEITDLQLKYRKDGVFRQFAIIGFKTVEQAKDAKEYFDGSFFEASKIQVEICTDFGDPLKLEKVKKDKKDKSGKLKEKEKHKSKYQEMLDEVKNDEDFTEFLELHKKGPNKLVWSNDAGEVAVDDDSSESSHVSEEDSTGDPETEKKEEKLVSSETTHTNQFDNEFTVKLRGLPYKCKKKNIKEFFHPLKIVSLRLPPRVKGIAYIKLASEKDMKKALNKHRSYLSGHKIDVVKYIKKKQDKPSDEMPNKYADKLKDLDEGIAESGRIFVRNLSYTVTEEDLENLFKSYGKLTEVNLPIDSFTKKIKGFAFVTFMFPENAVKAFSELDKTSFQGRLLHLLPSKPKKVEEEKSSNISSYKQKKQAMLKEICGSSESWNALFLGINALADVVADKYNTTKAELLDAKTKKESLAVRMALGETQVVEETRQFLMEQGVELDSFTLSAAERSKTVILVKNLPAKTKAEEIREVFIKFGSIVRVVLPPSGIAAIVEFESPSEARNAFNKLSYSRFRHVPLYLEWAPVNVFRSPPVQSNNTEHVTEEKTDVQSPVDKNDDKDDDPQPVNSILFVRNLNFTTTEEALRKHFQKAGKIHNVAIATKKDANNPGSLLSMGFGFVTYKQKESAQHALKTLQHSILDGRELELKFSNRATQPVVNRKEIAKGKQTGTKILIRNIPFEAMVKEVEELFRVFGELKHVRLPKKMIGTGSHRGFGFVDFVTKNDAKRAFNALCNSTHLYGRRLILEWAKTDDADISTLRRKTANNFYKAPSKKQKTVL